MCRARYKFSYRARTVGAARCLPPDCETSVHSGNDLVQPCIGARRSVPMADSDGVPGGAAGYASLSPRPLPPRSVEFRIEIGSPPHRDRAEASAGRHCPWKVVLPHAFGSSLPRPAPHLAENRALMRVGRCSSAGANGRGAPPWSPLRPAPAPQQPTRHGSWRSDRRRARTG